MKPKKGKRIKDMILPAIVMIVGIGILLLSFRPRPHTRVHYSLPKGCSGIFVVRVDANVEMPESESVDGPSLAFDVPKSGVVKIASHDLFGTWTQTSATLGGESIATEFSKASPNDIVLMAITDFSSDGEMRVFVGTQRDYEAVTRSDHLYQDWEPSLFVCE